MATLLVFNSTLGPTEETEAQKLLCYVPEDVGSDLKMLKLGLFEALVKFSSTFKPTRPCEAVRMKKRGFAVREVEPDYWFVLSRENAGETVGLQDELTSAYAAFKMAYGGLKYVLDSRGADALRQALSEFFGPAIAADATIAAAQGMAGAGLNGEALMAYVDGLNSVQQGAAAVRHVMVLSGDALVYADLTPHQVLSLAALLRLRTAPTSTSAETLPVFLDEQPYRAIVVLVGGLRVCAIVDADSTSDAHVIRLIQDHIPSLPPQAARTHSSGPVYLLNNELTGVHWSNASPEAQTDVRLQTASLLATPSQESLSNVVARTEGSWVTVLSGNDRQLCIEFPRSDGTLLTISDDIDSFVRKRCPDVLLPQ